MSDHKSDTKNLFEEFSPTSIEEWEKVLERDLNGANYKEKLKWQTLEGIDVQPFYRKEDLKSVAHYQKNVLPDTPADWKISEEIFAADPSKANQMAKEAVENGANAVRFTVRPTHDEGLLGPDIAGVQVHNLDDMSLLLDGIDPSKTEIIFDSGPGSAGILAMVRAYLETAGKNQQQYGSVFSFLYDPFTFMAGHGRLPIAGNELNSTLTQMSKTDGFKSLAADGSFYHNCGATIVQELGIALAIGSEYLARIPAELRQQASGKFWMQLAAGSLYFPEIAKFRAARLLWNRVLDGYEIEDRNPLNLHVKTSEWNKSAADPYNNMLRATTEAMSAAVGGADYITIQPFDAVYDEPNHFSRRIARNISHILEHESHIPKVANPSDGSYYIEKLTDQIAQNAWKFFQMIEKQGGFQKAIEAKIIQGEVARARKEKDEAIATRKLILTGVNNYPNSEEKIPDRLHKSIPVDSLKQSKNKPEVDPDKLIDDLSELFKNGIFLGDVVHSFINLQKQLYPALVTYRAAEVFEKMRLITQQYETKQGKKLTAQLVPVGNKKMRKARASFSQNYLECGGISVINLPGYETINDALSELKSSGAEIFVLCGSDDEYPELVPEFCSGLNKNSILILAGYPKNKIEEYSDMGIHLFIYSGSNMIQTLKEIQEKAGIVLSDK